MSPKTRNSLLGYGLSAALVDVIAAKGHTITLLRAMNLSQLTTEYGKIPGDLIKDRLARKPIDEAVVETIIAEADGCCCVCADGHSGRPYEIHHIDEYAKTQDNSKANLLLVCPTHHQTIHDRGITKSEQIEHRSRWAAVVCVAKDYRSAGLAFPYGAFVPFGYESPASIPELVEFGRVSASTANRICPGSIVGDAMTSGTTGNLTLIQGRSGSGKSTAALAVGGRLWSSGRRMFRYRAPADSREAIGEIMVFLKTASHPVGLILDDANSYCTPTDFHDLMAAAKGEVHLVVVWTHAEHAPSQPGIAATRSVVITWHDIQPTLRALLLEHEIAIVKVLNRLSPKSRVGVTEFDETLESRIDRYSTSAATVSEFMFLLRGGSGVVAAALRRLHDQDRADIPVLYAAAEQIAGFEKAVSPAETADSLRQLRSFSPSSPLTEKWIGEVFARETGARLMVYRRGLFTTVHRDWARTLLVAGLDEQRTRETAKELLDRDFDVVSGNLDRLARLWSWLWSSYGAGASFVRQWASGLSAEQWSRLVSRSSAAGITSVGFFAGRMHLLLKHEEWTKTVGAAMETNERELVACLLSATPADWYSISELFMAVSHAAPVLGDRLRIAWGPARVANLLMSSAPGSMDRASWCMSQARARQPDWCRAVCDNLEWDRIVENLGRVRPGDVESVFETWSLLEQLGYPMRRSMLRACVDAMCGAVAKGRLQDLRFFGLNGLAALLSFYPDEANRFRTSIDAAHWAADLADCHPRHWRVITFLTTFLHSQGTDFVWQPLEMVDIERFAANVTHYAPATPYEFRCLLWVLRSSTQARRAHFAAALEPTVESVMRASDAERDAIASAFFNLAPDRAEAMRIRLQAAGVTIMPPKVPKSEFAECAASIVALLRERDRRGDDYVLAEVFAEIGHV